MSLKKEEYDKLLTMTSEDEFFELEKKIIIKLLEGDRILEIGPGV